MNNAVYIPKSVMVIVAHPDDIEYTCAGTVARWVRAGAEAYYVLCTSGDAGIDDPDITRGEAMRIREREQLAAAELVGVKEVIFLREPDGLLENTIALRRRLVREIRRLRPEVVMIDDPTQVLIGSDYINHPDHRAAGMAALDAAFPAAGQRHVFAELADEGLVPHKVRKVYVFCFDQADTYVNITDTIDVKIAALKAHASQMREFDPEPMMRQWASEAAKGKEMQYAEGFRVITLVRDEDKTRTETPAG